MSEAHSKSVPAPVVAIAGWVLPGLGYWFLGQRARALTVGIVILALFVFGVLIGGMHVVDAPDNIGTVLGKPWFIGQFLVGPIALFCCHYADANHFPLSQNHVHEIGTLYTAIAGILNLMVILDATYRAGTAAHSPQESAA